MAKKINIASKRIEKDIMPVFFRRILKKKKSYTFFTGVCNYDKGY